MLGLAKNHEGILGRVSTCRYCHRSIVEVTEIDNSPEWGAPDKDTPEYLWWFCSLPEPVEDGLIPENDGGYHEPIDPLVELVLSRLGGPE